MLGFKMQGEPYRFYSSDPRGPKNQLDKLSFVQEAPSLPGDVKLAAVHALTVPKVRELSGPDKTGLYFSTVMSRLCTQMDVKRLILAISSQGKPYLAASAASLTFESGTVAPSGY